MNSEEAVDLRPREREEEKRLVRAARAGDSRALRALVDAHQDRLFAFIWRMVRSHHDAEEICQEAFLKAFAALDSYSTKFRFSTWLFTIGYRVCLNSMRRRRALTGSEIDFSSLPMSSPESASEVAESEEAARLRELVWGAVERLSPPQRATVLLFYRHEQSCHEIAQVLQMPLATVKSHLHRARARLRELLEAVSDDSLQAYRSLAG